MYDISLMVLLQCECRKAFCVDVLSWIHYDDDNDNDNDDNNNNNNKKEYKSFRKTKPTKSGTLYVLYRKGLQLSYQTLLGSLSTPLNEHAKKATLLLKKWMETMSLVS